MKQLQHEVRCLEATQKEAISSTALKKWLETKPSAPASQQIQSLSYTITELDRLFNDNMTLRPLEDFEQWLTESLMVQQDRSSSPSLSEEIRFVRPLGRQWCQQMHGLLRVAQMHQSTLVELGEAIEESGVALILNRYCRLANTLVKEISTALAIGKTMAQVETSWEQTELEKVVGEIRSTGATDSHETYQHSPAWM